MRGAALSSFLAVLQSSTAQSPSAANYHHRSLRAPAADGNKGQSKKLSQPCTIVQVARTRLLQDEITALTSSTLFGQEEEEEVGFACIVDANDSPNGKPNMIYPIEGDGATMKHLKNLFDSPEEGLHSGEVELLTGDSNLELDPKRGKIKTPKGAKPGLKKKFGHSKNPNGADKHGFEGTSRRLATITGDRNILLVRVLKTPSDSSVGDSSTTMSTMSLEHPVERYISNPKCSPVAMEHTMSYLAIQTMPSLRVRRE